MSPGAGPNRIPAAEIDITDELVAALLASQHPDLADRGLRRVASGWDNVIYRLGDDLAVRLPRRTMGAELAEREQRWLPLLAPRLPLPVPAPVRVGRPEYGYPWVWSITPWFDGEVAADVELADESREARRLGAFMSALHEPAPPDAPTHPTRGGFIGDRRGTFESSLELVVDVLDGFVPSGSRVARQRWDELARTTPFAGPPMWLAGDVHTGNLVVQHGEIVAVIDFGDLCAGDPAVDLAVGWMLFDPPERREFREAASHGAVAVDDAMWRRAEGWAWQFAVLYLANSADDERLERMGRALARTLLSECVG